VPVTSEDSATLSDDWRLDSDDSETRGVERETDGSLDVMVVVLENCLLTCRGK